MELLWTHRDWIKVNNVNREPFCLFECSQRDYMAHPALWQRLVSAEDYKQRVLEMSDDDLRSFAVCHRGLVNASHMRLDDVRAFCLTIKDLDGQPLYLGDDEPEALADEVEEFFEEAEDFIEEEPLRITSLDELRADAWLALEAEDYNACKASCSALEVTPVSWKKGDVFEALQDYLLGEG